MGPDDNKIGSINEIYFDDETGEPEWVTVKTGLFGRHVSFVPLEGISSKGDHLATRWDKDMVKDAPNIEPDGHLSESEERRLYEHYELSWSTGRSEHQKAGRHGTEKLGSDKGGDTSGPSTDDAMTRSEEELRVDKSTSQTGKARLRKWVETEHQEKEVPVVRERATVQREPITDENVGDAMDGPAISEEEHEMPLYEEEVVANTEVKPKERVRLDKKTETETETVSGDVRKERIDVEGDAPRGG
jgi:uncharacterized protein (TIGR02271 family)